MGYNLEVMTDLEQKIYDYAMEVMPQALEVIETADFGKSKTFRVGYMNKYGVANYLIYDLMLERFTKIEYSYGVGKATIIKGMDENVGLFDDYETRFINLE